MKHFNVKTQRVTVHADSTMTSGAIAVLELSHPVETGAPLHRHKREDEGFYILSGTYVFRLGEERMELSTGQYLFAPRGVAHGFRCTSNDGGRMLVTCTPAGIENYFEEMSKTDWTSPSASKECARLDGKYGITILRS